MLHPNGQLEYLASELRMSRPLKIISLRLLNRNINQLASVPKRLFCAVAAHGGAPAINDSVDEAGAG